MGTRTTGHQDNWAPGQLGTGQLGTGQQHGHQNNRAPGQLDIGQLGTRTTQYHHCSGNADRYTTTDCHEVAATQTDYKANLPLRQLTAKEQGSKNHFAPYRFMTIAYLITE